MRSKIKLLAFQQTAVANITAAFNNEKSVLLQSATGSGKTVIASSFIADHLKISKKNRVLVLANLQAIVPQFWDTLNAFGLNASVLHDAVDRNKHGVFFHYDPKDRVLLTMPETLINTLEGTNKLYFDTSWEPTCIVIDEAHKGTSSLYQAIRAAYPKAIILGLTATPYREKSLDGEHLTEWYGTNLITTISVAELIELGRLVKPIYIRKKQNDHFLNTYLEVTRNQTNKSSVVFTTNTKHSFAILEALQMAGITAAVITAGSDDEQDFKINPQTPLQRQTLYNRFERGEIEVLISVIALCEGFDCERAHNCFLMRTVGNHALYQQMIGRVLRAHSSKKDAIIVDFYGNLQQHGTIEDYCWKMEAPKPSNRWLEPGEREISTETWVRHSAIYHTCADCANVYNIKKNSICNHCGLKHSVERTEPVANRLVADFNLERKKYPQFLATLRGMKARKETQEIFNKRFNKTVFLNGTIANEYAYLATLHENSWNEKLRIVA